MANSLQDSKFQPIDQPSQQQPIQQPIQQPQQPQQQQYSQQMYQQQPIQPIQQPIRTISPPYMRYKNKFLTFMCALVPGCGQMYHGLLKKGLTVMIAFWGILAISTWLYLPPLAFALPIIWFYSFFDAVNRMNMPIEEMRLLKDTSILDMPKTENKELSRLFLKRHLIFGWALTIIGIYAIVSVTVERVLGYFGGYDLLIVNWIEWVLRTLPAIVIPIVCVIFGVKLIIATKDKDENISQNISPNVGE